MRILTAFILLLTGTAFAADGWIDDNVRVPMRSGAGTQYRIIQNAINSGTYVQVLETEDGWTRIRLNDTEGYVPSQYVSTTPTAAVKLAQVERQLASLNATHEKTSTELAALKKQTTELDRELSSTRKKLTSSEQSLDRVQQIAADPIKISEINKQLNQTISLLETELDQLKAQNTQLENDQTYKGWAFGLGTILLGMILGAWMKARGRRAGSTWV